MSSQNSTWGRRELYEKVWQFPLRKLAAEYGISDVGLAKVYRKLEIPLPGLGHWTKIACGHSILRPPLPALENVPVLVRQIRKPEIAVLPEDTPELAGFVTFPTPGKRPTGSGNKRESTSAGWMTNRPFGFFQSDAILARNLFGATPAEAVRLRSARICWRMTRATSVAAGSLVLFADTSRYASSSERGSMRSAPIDDSLLRQLPMVGENHVSDRTQGST